MRRCMMLAACAVFLSGCTVDYPILVENDMGLLMRGRGELYPTGGSFSIMDQSLTCSGSYESYNTEWTFVIPTTCSDGRTGTVLATRDSGLSGRGTMTLNDGTTVRFFYGAAAAYHEYLRGLPPSVPERQGAMFPVELPSPEEM